MRQAVLLLIVFSAGWNAAMAWTNLRRLRDLQRSIKETERRMAAEAPPQKLH